MFCIGLVLNFNSINLLKARYLAGKRAKQRRVVVFANTLKTTHKNDFYSICFLSGPIKIFFSICHFQKIKTWVHYSVLNNMCLQLITCVYNSKIDTELRNPRCSVHRWGKTTISPEQI